MRDFLFSPDLMPHGYCYLWRPEIVWLHAVSDTLIALAYYLIPVMLVYFARKRKDLPFHWVFLMFGLFIFGCGTTHLMEVWTLWHANYGLAGVIKGITAGASMATAALLVPLLPRALALPSPAQLRTTNLELEKVIAERRRVEEELQGAHAELELRVRQRTAQLAEANLRLQAEIVERRRAEEVLRKQANLLELAHDAIIVRDMDDRITYWNSGAEGTYGWKRDEAVGSIAQQLLQSVYPSDLEQLKLDVVRDGRWDGELTQTRSDGTSIVVASRWALLRDDSGDPVATLQINTDITARKRAIEELAKSEQRWRAVFDNSTVGIALTDLNGRFQAANFAFQKMMGYSRRELLGMSFMDITDEDDRERSWTRFAELPVENRQYFETKKRNRRKDGSVIWVDIDVSLVPGTESIPQFMLAMVDDITERKRAEAALLATQSQLAHIARVTTMGELVASIAHEINQPLTAVVTNANASLRWLGGADPNMEEARLAITRIIKEGNRASDVIGKIRSFLKKSPAQTASLDINEVIREVLVLTHHEILSNRVSLQTDLESDIPAVMGDRVQLQQVLFNLIRNAIEATCAPESGARDLLVTSHWREPGRVVVAVRDSGGGIDPLHLDQLFNPFFTTKPDGMGMGLSISRSIIEAHGGRLWAAPGEGHGATFQFSLAAAAATGNV
jgi:PAS domain S-box-containing protein